MGLIVRSSDVHAAGVFTTAPIKKGSKVVEYTGPRITKEQGDKLYEHRDITYLFAVGNGDVAPFLLKKDAEAYAAKISGKVLGFDDAVKAAVGGGKT